MKQLAKWTLVPLFFTLTAAALFAADWKPAEGILLTKFAKDVDPTLPLPEYPRPQLTRETWANLNGLWDYAIVPAGTSEGEFAPILVPFPVESALSGVAKPVGKANELLAAGREDAAALVAQHLRAALESVGRITGRVYGEELLTSVFSRFCIGK